jgi:hypothetical protein
MKEPDGNKLVPEAVRKEAVGMLVGVGAVLAMVVVMAGDNPSGVSCLDFANRIWRAGNDQSIFPTSRTFATCNKRCAAYYGPSRGKCLEDSDWRTLTPPK